MNLEEATIKALEGKLDDKKVIKSLDPEFCPICGESTIAGDVEFGHLVVDYHSDAIDDFDVYYPFHCNKCGANGREYQALSFIYMEANKKDLTENKKSDWKSYIKQFAEDSYETGHPLNLDDFNEFIHLMKDTDFKLSDEEYKKAWDYYWEYFNDYKYNQNIKDLED